MKNLTFILFINLICANAQAETLILKADKWCPFICDTSSKAKEPGYIVEITRIIFERKGHNIDYQTDTWSNSITSVRNGEATGIVATTMPEAPDFIYSPKNMGNTKECFYVRQKDPWEFLKVENLKERKLGIVEANNLSAELMSYLKENPSQIVKSEGTTPLLMNLQNLDAKKIDTIMENPIVFNYTTESMKVRDKYEEAGCTSGDLLYVGFSPKNPRSKEFAKILTEGLEDLKKDGTLDKIINKYSLKDWSP